MTSVVPHYSPSERGECAGCGKVVKRTAKSAAVQYCKPCRATGIARGGCGTVTGYSDGCRCQECRGAVAAVVRRNATKRRIDADPTLLEKRRCIEDGCDYEATSDRIDRCRGCHAQFQRALVAEGRKWCTKCREIKAVAEFRVTGAKVRSTCRPCDAAQSAEWRERNPGYGTDYMRRVRDERGYARRARFGLTPADVRAMLEAQHGRCGICDESVTPEGINIDHCHSTGRIRAILCRSCNLGLGFFKDDPARMERAAEYIREHAQT